MPFLQLSMINDAIFQPIEWKQNHLLIFLKKRNYWRQGEDQSTWWNPFQWNWDLLLSFTHFIEEELEPACEPASRGRGGKGVSGYVQPTGEPGKRLPFLD